MDFVHRASHSFPLSLLYRSSIRTALVCQFFSRHSYAYTYTVSIYVYYAFKSCASNYTHHMCTLISSNGNINSRHETGTGTGIIRATFIPTNWLRSQNDHGPKSSKQFSTHIKSDFAYPSHILTHTHIQARRDERKYIDLCMYGCVRDI